MGFNSVYHLTDVVSFVSGRYLNVMDPHQKYCCLRGEPGLQYDITSTDGVLGVDGLESLDDIADTLAGFCPGFEWCPAHSPSLLDSTETDDDVEKFTYCPALVNSEPPVKKSRLEEIDQSASSISQIEQFNNEAATVSYFVKSPKPTSSDNRIG